MTQAPQSGPAAHRLLTFDCPWCGAISRVPASTLGEHFPCPECKRVTRLTEANASDRPPTLPPPDAPHLSGDRTFDCPWCGAISAVPSSHLGERFHCPECGKETKLTAANTQRAPVTAPPPDAPHVPSGAGRRALALVAVVVVIGVVIWLVVGGGDSGSKEVGRGGSTPAAMDSGTKPPPPMPTPPTGPEPGMTEPGMDTASPAGMAPPMPAPPPGTPEPGMTEPTPVPPPTVPATPDPLEVARAEWLAATTVAAEKNAALQKAEAAIADWRNKNPEASAAAADLPALQDFLAEAKRLLDAKDPISDPKKPTPTQVRAYNAALAKFAGEKAERVRAMERLLDGMKKDAKTASEVADREWKDLNFFGGSVRNALAHAAETWIRVATPPADLEAVRAVAAREAGAAQKAVDEADRKVKALETKTGGK